jgi:hypothetical protein
MVWGMPGIGGGLGKCALCGDTFCRDILGLHADGEQRMVAVVGINGLGDVALHQDCRDKLEGIVAAGADWHDLPTGPLRDVFAQQEAAHPKEPTDGE